MLEQTPKVKCPLCEGQGELIPAQIVETFSTPELRKRLEARIAEIGEISGLTPAVAGGKVLDFQKKVHTWNPALPIWRRSPKE